MTQHTLNPEHWIDRFGNILLNYALVRVPERDIARDLVQETFVTALRSKANYRGEISEKNWLFLILRSRILDYYKKKKEVLESDFAQDDEDDSNFFTNSGHWLKDRMPKDWSTDQAIRNKEFMQVFEACLQGLKHAQKEAFSLKYVEGMSSEEICKELDVTSSNYWVLVHRAKLKLRACLEKNWLKA